MTSKVVPSTIGRADDDHLDLRACPIRLGSKVFDHIALWISPSRPVIDDERRMDRLAEQEQSKIGEI
jgi:hypothetical protein